MRPRLASFGCTPSLQIGSYTGRIVHHAPTKAWNVAVRNVTVVITSEESTMCTPLYCPRMFEHWVTQPSALSLTSLSLPLSLSHSHTLSSRPSVLGEYMRRSDPTLILLPLLSIIQSALLGKWKNGQKKRKKKKRPHKQINNSSLSDSCSMEISPSHIFLIIWFYRRWGWALCSHIVYLQIIFGRMPHFFFSFFLSAILR